MATDRQSSVSELKFTIIVAVNTRDIRWSEGDDEGGNFMRQMKESKSLSSYESAGQTGGIFNLEFNTEG